jgi:hypothetical protein
MARRIMISDDDLLLYYYRDGLDAAERARIGAALSEQPEIAQRLHRLIGRLDEVAALPEVPVPAYVRQRWQVALERAAVQGDASRVVAAGRRYFTHLRWPAAAAAAVAVLALAGILSIPLMMRPSLNRPTATALPASTQAVPSMDDASAYKRRLRWHLANTEQRLASLDSVTPDEANRLIETIIAQNEMYALAAERAHDPRLARVLRAFAPILESLWHDGKESSESSIAQLNFELRAMQARLSAETDTPSTVQSEPF